MFLLTSNYEGYGRTIVEAMAAGCPVVMTDVGIAREVIVDNKTGYVIPVGNTQTLTQTIAEFHKQTEMRKKFQENSFAVLARFKDKAGSATS